VGGEVFGAKTHPSPPGRNQSRRACPELVEGGRANPEPGTEVPGHLTEKDRVPVGTAQAYIRPISLLESSTPTNQSRKLGLIYRPNPSPPPHKLLVA
jgi:hypothetical protein